MQMLLASIAVMLLIAVGLSQPAGRRDWRAMGAFAAFIVALFAEMYGFPLTVYLLSGWLGSSFPGLSVSDGGGHPWADLTGWQGNPRLSPFHLVSYLAIAGGCLLIWSGWRALWAAQRRRRIACERPYAWIRHPQYSGFLLIMVGYLVQWPTIPTLAIFPVLTPVTPRQPAGRSRRATSHAAQP
jgi:protein-S-isoprenylcysteine O-methyltransferase Ste14